MKNKIIYLLILIFSIGLIASAKKITGHDVTARCKANKEKLAQKQAATGVLPEASTLSLFFFNI